MSKHRFHGDPERFQAVTDFITSQFGKRPKYIADVAGGQGMLSRMLNKAGYEAEVVDPRGWTLVGIKSRQEAYSSDMADYYDLIIGLHPDDALREVVLSAKSRPILVVPCCNFWDKSQKLGTKPLIEAIEQFYKSEGIRYETVELGFKGPKNVAILAQPRSVKVQ